MTQNCTVSDLFDLAITAEKEVARFYGQLSGVFRNHPPAVACWTRMASDEQAHVRELEGRLRSLSRAEMSQEADIELYEAARKNLSHLIGLLGMRTVRTLEDAYEIAYDLEYSEVNVVFQALLSRYGSVASNVDFVLSLIREHVGCLEQLAKECGGIGQMRDILSDK
jgi:rubrerythrin